MLLWRSIRVDPAFLRSSDTSPPISDFQPFVVDQDDVYQISVDLLPRLSDYQCSEVARFSGPGNDGVRDFHTASMNFRTLELNYSVNDLEIKAFSSSYEVSHKL